MKENYDTCRKLLRSRKVCLIEVSERMMAKNFPALEKNSIPQKKNPHDKTGKTCKI